MSPAKELHRAAMVLADLAMEAERRAAELYREAAKLERRAVDASAGHDREILMESLRHLKEGAAMSADTRAGQAAPETHGSELIECGCCGYRFFREYLKDYEHLYPDGTVGRRLGPICRICAGNPLTVAVRYPAVYPPGLGDIARALSYIAHQIIAEIRLTPRD